MNYVWYSTVLDALGDLDGAERAIESAIRHAARGPFHIDSTLVYVELLLKGGKTDRAKAEFDSLWANYRYTNPERFPGYLARLGYDEEARELTAKFSQQPDVDPFNMFLASYGLGRYGDALVWLRRAVDDRFLQVCMLRLPNQFPGLQEQPGYAELLTYLDSIQRSR